MVSSDNRFEFSGFISKNLIFQENFSIGLVFHVKLEKLKIVLLRVNGPHGPNEFSPHHNGPHLHYATEETIRAGLKPESNVDINVPYATLEDAIQFYCDRINLNTGDRVKYFPIPSGSIQLGLNFGDNNP